MYIYCTETFWYVMQEQALFFNKIYGTQVRLIPVRAERTESATENGIDITADHRAPRPWRFMEEREEREEREKIIVPRAQLHPDIEQQIRRIGTSGYGDLFISDSPRHSEMVSNANLFTSDYLVCYLTLSMLVPSGNPHRLHSIRDVLDTNRRLGIMEPSFDGLGEASWIVLKRMFSGDESAIPMEFIHTFERQYDLLEALELGNIDAALVWDATSQIGFLLIKYADRYNATYERVIRDAERRRDHHRLREILQRIHRHIVETYTFAEAVSLTENPDERLVVAVRLVVLSSATSYGRCQRFADFMRSRLGREIFRRFGFVAE